LFSYLVEGCEKNVLLLTFKAQKLVILAHLRELGEKKTAAAA